AVTTFEPGARLVFTQGLTCKPRSTAFLATNPAPSISEGLEVFVQLVMAAITTAPLESSKPSPLFFTGTFVAGVPSTTLVKDAFAFLSATRSCGRFGPATVGSTLLRSSSSESLNAGSGVASVRKRYCSLQ